MMALRGVLGAIATVAVWYWLVMATPLAHQAVFAVVPPAGMLSRQERINLDHDVTAFVRYFPSSSDGLPGLAQLSAAEVEHLNDVRAVHRSILRYVLPVAFVGSLMVRLRPAILTWSLGVVAGIGVVTLVAFNAAFTALHPVLFPAGNWVFPAEDYLLTRMYPAGFFAASWILILLGSILTLWGIRATLARHESH